MSGAFEDENAAATRPAVASAVPPRTAARVPKRSTIIARGDERDPRSEEARGQDGAELGEAEAVGLAELRPDRRQPEADEGDRGLGGARADEDGPSRGRPGCHRWIIVAAMDRQAIARAQRRRQATDALEFERARADALRERLETIVAELDGAAIDERPSSRRWRPSRPPWSAPSSTAPSPSRSTRSGPARRGLSGGGSRARSCRAGSRDRPASGRDRREHPAAAGLRGLPRGDRGRARQ